MAGAYPVQKFHPNTTNDIAVALAASGLSIEAYAEKLTDDFFAFKASHGFDGFDLDIEAGVQLADGDPYNDDTFLNPTGTIDLIVRFIRKSKARDPALLITLAPQSPEISPKFGGGWIAGPSVANRGNYSAIIQQVAEDLTFVGVQFYNQITIVALDGTVQPSGGDVGSVQGPWQVDYMSAGAVCLLEPWPSEIDGNSTNFPPFTNVLAPQQVVLGLISGNSTAFDGQPLYSNTTMRQTINCLRSGTDCGTSYTPPSTYPLSGVFAWNLTEDMATGFQFAKDAAPCVETATVCII